MNTIKQIIAVTLLNLRNLPKRLGSSAVAVVGVGSVVLVFAFRSQQRPVERTNPDCCERTRRPQGRR
jgi:hypothetical protein